MMALDHSTELFSPQMNSTSLFLWFQLVIPSFDPNGHYMNNFDKGLHGDATYQKSKLYPFKVSEKKNFEVGLLCSYVPNCDPQGGVSFDPKEII